jgi:hypothetical protein
MKVKNYIIAAVATTLLALSLTTQGATTIDANNRFSYGANIGWMTWRDATTNGAAIGEYVCSGYIYSANVGWISLGSGTPTNGIRYSNISGTDFGVNHDGMGNLNGLAYGANIGWITFPTNASGVKVDLNTGSLSGAVYSANCGWISLSNAFAFVETDSILSGTDSDSDGIADAWERTYFGNLVVANDETDYDGDSRSDLGEYLADTSPLNQRDYLHVISNTVQFNSLLDTDTLNWTSRPTRKYRIHFRTGLDPATNWTDTGMLVAPSIGENTIQAVSFVTPASQRFFRVQAVKPLQ